MAQNFISNKGNLMVNILTIQPPTRRALLVENIQKFNVKYKEFFFSLWPKIIVNLIVDLFLLFTHLNNMVAGKCKFGPSPLGRRGPASSVQ